MPNAPIDMHSYAKSNLCASDSVVVHCGKAVAGPNRGMSALIRPTMPRLWEAGVATCHIMPTAVGRNRCICSFSSIGGARLMRVYAGARYSSQGFKVSHCRLRSQWHQNNQMRENSKLDLIFFMLSIVSISLSINHVIITSSRRSSSK